MSDLNVLEREHEQKILMYLLILYHVSDFKMSEINTIDGDAVELQRLNTQCEGIKTRISLIEIELKKDEKVESTNLNKQLLIAQIGLQINRINPKEITVSEWIEITKLLEEKSKQN